MSEDYLDTLYSVFRAKGAEAVASQNETANGQYTTVPITVSGQAYEYETSWEYPNTECDLVTTRAMFWITRKQLYSGSQLPYDIVNKDVMDAELPNLFFVFRGDKYGFFCSVSESGRELRTAVWRVGVMFWL